MRYSMNTKGRVTHFNGYSLTTLLNLAAAETMTLNYLNALSLLSAARLIARDNDKRAIAAHCTQAMQALYVCALDDYMRSGQ